MPALEHVAGLRVVAEAAALDAATWSSAEGHPVIVLRIAPDEAVGLGATAVEVVDSHAIVAEEHGLVAARCAIGDIAPRIEWRLPSERPALAQGAVAGVPAKVWFHEAVGPREDDSDLVLLVTWAAYAHDLADRLGWSA